MPVLTKRYSPLKTTSPAPPAAAPAPAPAASPAPAIKKLNLTGFAKKKDSGATSEYPAFPDPTGKAAETAAAIRSMQEEFEALEGSLKAHKKFLIDLTAPFHFTNSSGKAEPAKAVVVEAGLRKEDGTLEMLGTRVRVDFKHKYPTLEDESVLVPVLGEAVGAFFRQKFALTIDGDKLPNDKVDDLLAKLQRLFAEFNATDALTVKAGFAPVDDFHVKRHTVFTPEQNLELQKVCPIQAAVATKNVK
jgi:hypothetical protein